MWGSYPASLLDVGGSTEVTTLASYNAQGAPDAFLHKWNYNVIV
jgi:hypothetical protein